MSFHRARTAQLVIQALPEETLIFDQRTGKAHCLNRTTALVWKHCDGRTGLSAMARQTGLGEPLVQLALEQLASLHLLEGSVERGSPTQRRSRRGVLKQPVATAALPVAKAMAGRDRGSLGENMGKLMAMSARCRRGVDAAVIFRIPYKFRTMQRSCDMSPM